MTVTAGTNRLISNYNETQINIHNVREREQIRDESQNTITAGEEKERRGRGSSCEILEKNYCKVINYGCQSSSYKTFYTKKYCDIQKNNCEQSSKTPMYKVFLVYFTLKFYAKLCLTFFDTPTLIVKVNNLYLYSSAFSQLSRSCLHNCHLQYFCDFFKIIYLTFTSTLPSPLPPPSPAPPSSSIFLYTTNNNTQLFKRSFIFLITFFLLFNTPTIDAALSQPEKEINPKITFFNIVRRSETNQVHDVQSIFNDRGLYFFFTLQLPFFYIFSFIASSIENKHLCAKL